MNFKANDSLSLSPESAIVVYRGHDNNYNERKVVLAHKIKKDGLMGVGRHLNLSMMKRLFQQDENEINKTFHFIPKNIISINNEGIIWFEPSRYTEIYFEPTEKNRRQLKKYSGQKTIWPPLLFILNNNNLFCFALKENRRPHETTKLYHAPLTHISETDGHVCLPSRIRSFANKTPLQNYEIISKTFYDGVFGHKTGSMKQINHPGGHDKFWIEHIQANPKRFPSEKLIPFQKLTLKDILV